MPFLYRVEFRSENNQLLTRSLDVALVACMNEALHLLVRENIR